VNIGLNNYIGDNEYLEALNRFLPKAKAYNPDIILVSAGFDGLEGDPLGQSHLSPNCYREMTKIIKSICQQIVLVLEGGYNLTKTAEAFSQCVDVLLE
jgi:histone deacetylase 6